jgi:glutaminyl-tRNA synthetase
MLEHAIREDLDANATRAMCVLNPLKVVIEDYPEDQVQELSQPHHPQKEEMGRRPIFFTREVYIDRNDFEEEAPAGWKRLFTGGEVRLRGCYVIKCNEVVKDEDGNIIELRCTHDENTLGKKPEGRKVKGVIHWVSATESLPAEVRLYDRLFNDENPDANREDGKTFLDFINPDSLTVAADARVEKSVANTTPETHYQFEREGYFTTDKDSTSEKLIFNRTVTLRDSWAKAKK